MKTGKAWGETECVIASPTFELHKLRIKPNHKCSLHRHRHKWNAFVVVSGTLFVDVVKQDYPLVDTTTLRAGEQTAVRPGEHHRFRTGKQWCVAYEMYYLEALSDDIDRKDHGGVCTADDNRAIVHSIRQGPGR